MIVKPQNMDRGYAFAHAFRNACFAAMQEHPNIHLYHVEVFDENTAFVLANGNLTMLVDTKMRTHAWRGRLFGINAGEWQRLRNPNIQVFGTDVRTGQRRNIIPGQVAILAYLSQALENGRRLFAQWLPNIRVAEQGPEFVDTELASYANLSAILQEGIGIEPELAQQIKQQTLANALAIPALNPNAA